MLEFIKRNLTTQYACLALYLVSVSLNRTANIAVYPDFTIAGYAVSYLTIKSVLGIVIIASFIAGHKKLDTLVLRREWKIASAVLCVLGNAVILAPSFTSTALASGAALLITLVGNLLMWVGTQFLFCSIVSAFSNGQSRTQGVAFAFFASILVIGILQVAPAFVELAASIAVPPVICLLLLRFSKSASVPAGSAASAPSGTAPAATDEQSDKLRMLVIAFYAFVFFFALATSFSRTIYLSEPQDYGFAPVVITYGSALLASLTLAISVRSYNRFNVIAFYRATFLFFVVSYCLTPLFEKHFGLIYHMQFVADMLFHCLTFVVIYKLCLRTALSCVLAFSMVRLLRCVASVLVSSVEQSSFWSESLVIPIIMLFIIGFTINYTVGFTEKNMWTLTEKKRATNEKKILTDKAAFISEKYDLSPRQHEILEYLVQGRNTPYIAEALSISPRTVNVHVRNIHKKMGVHSRQEILDLYAKISV